MDRIFDQIEQSVKSVFERDSSGHDLYHLKRVFTLALRIQSQEGGSALVIGCTALTHDVHRIIENTTGVFCSPEDSLPKVREILDKSDLTNSDKTHVLHCVAHHEEYGFSKDGKTVADIETMVLQDADNLDAIGALGIARTFAFGGAHHVPMWIPEIPLDREKYDESERDPSVIHHFHSKLLRLKGNMNTQTGLQMAQARHQFMEDFVKQFQEEWLGKR